MKEKNQRKNRAGLLYKILFLAVCGSLGWHQCTRTSSPEQEVKWAIEEKFVGPIEPEDTVYKMTGLLDLVRYEKIEILEHENKGTVDWYFAYAVVDFKIRDDEYDRVPPQKVCVVVKLSKGHKEREHAAWRNVFECETPPLTPEKRQAQKELAG